MAWFADGIAAVTRRRACSWPSDYVEVFRGVPALTQLFLIYFGLRKQVFGWSRSRRRSSGWGWPGSGSDRGIPCRYEALHHGQREAAWRSE